MAALTAATQSRADEAIPSPMHDGPGDAPEEPVFVVDRFIAF